MSATLIDADFARAAKELGVEAAAIRAVAEVEAAGAGFLPDGRPAVLYEAHIFHKHTKGKHAGAKDRRGVALSSPSWNKALYGATGAAQHARYEDARKLDPDAANKACGFDTSQAFVDAMWTGGAAAHLDAFVAFIKADPKLHNALRAKQWAAFARIYNGPGYAANAYDQKMANAYARWKARG